MKKLFGSNISLFIAYAILLASTVVAFVGHPYIAWIAMLCANVVLTMFMITKFGSDAKNYPATYTDWFNDISLIAWLAILYYALQVEGYPWYKILLLIFAVIDIILDLLKLFKQIKRRKKNV